jgi:hypothetical protein
MLKGVAIVCLSKNPGVMPGFCFAGTLASFFRITAPEKPSLIAYFCISLESTYGENCHQYRNG